MPHSQFSSKLSSSRETVQPLCPKCQARMKRLRAVPGRPGFEHWTLRCAKCGLIHEAQVPAA
jgi:tRNA(Ile2) C34 agmatinyltransferase TiaS